MTKTSALGRRLSLVLAAAILTLLPACLTQLMPSKKDTGVTMEQVKAAEAKKDIASLKSVASGKTRAWKNRTKIRNEAGNAVARLAQERGDVKELYEVCNGKPHYYSMDSASRRAVCRAAKAARSAGAAKELAGDCSKLEGVYNKHKLNAGEFFFKVGIRAAECNNWDFIWSKLAFWGTPSRHAKLNIKRKMGHELMYRLEQAGHDPASHFLAYLQKNSSNPFGFEHGALALRNATRYLRETNKVGACKRYIPFAKRSGKRHRAEWVWFFAETSCKAAARFAVSMLTSESADSRRLACKALGKIGSRRQLRKVKTLASTDPAYRIVRLNKIWYVRDACRAAAGQIAMRN